MGKKEVMSDILFSFCWPLTKWYTGDCRKLSQWSKGDTPYIFVKNTNCMTFPINCVTVMHIVQGDEHLQNQ